MSRQIDTSMAITRTTVPVLDETLGYAYPVLDHGFIRVIDYLGDDAAIVQAARVSYGKGTKSVSQDEGLIRHAGVSVYSVEAALRALDLDGLDLIQVSGSLFDRRMLRADFFGKARQARKAVFVRSVYLQGLVGPAAADLPAAMAFAREALETLHGFCESNRISPRLLGLAYAARRFESALVVLGAETESQVGDNLRIWQAAQSVPDDLLAAWDTRWPNDEMPLIDPRKWGMA